MHKSIFAFSILNAMTAVALAQTSVTVYGTVDGGTRYQTNTNATGGNTLSQTSGQFFANRLGFKGAEDLGGGLQALFDLESGYAIDTGAQDVAGSLFNRMAIVGLSNELGSLMVGRNYTVAYRTAISYDVLAFHYPTLVPLLAGAGTSQSAAAMAAGLGASATSGLRLNNDVQYIGKFGGLTARAEYSPGEAAGSLRSGRVEAVGVSYSFGEFNVGSAYTIKYTGQEFRNTARTAGGAWTHDQLKVTLGYADEKQDSATLQYRNRLMWSGVAYQFTPAFTLAGAYYRTQAIIPNLDGKRDLYVVSGVYALSKRTVLYSDIDFNRYQGSLVPTTRQTHQLGMSMGIQTSF